MARIIKNTDENKNNENSNNSENKTRLVKTVGDGQKEDEIKEPKKKITFNSNLIIEWFVDFFGNDLFEELKENPDLKIPYDDEDHSAKKWLENVLKTILTQKNIESIEKSIKEKYYELLKMIDEAEKVIIDQKKENSEIKAEFEEFKAELLKSRKEVDKLAVSSFSSVHIKDLADIVFGKNDELKGFATLFKEAANDPSEQLPEFTIAFLKGWNALYPYISKDYSSEEDKAEIIDEKLRNLLAFVKDKYIPQRRAILDVVARIVSKKFKEFIFISPEETLQIDINIHKTDGEGGNRIKQGLSFAIVRKATQKAFKYAEIEVI